MARAGRPPKVLVDGNEATVVVKGEHFTFRKGSDGRLRAIGATPTDSEEYGYAKQQVLKIIAANLSV